MKSYEDNGNIPAGYDEDGERLPATTNPPMVDPDTGGVHMVYAFGRRCNTKGKIEFLRNQLRKQKEINK